MAGKGTARATNDAPKAGLKQENEALKAVRAEKGENPYKGYPLHIPGLLRAILCEIWELRRDIRSK